MSRRLIEKADARLSREQGTVFKDPGGRINIALAYPNRYSVGMSNLGFQGIYGLLNGMQDVVCERVFLPDEEDMDEWARTGTEPFALESKRPLSAFDILAFSVSFENDMPNVVRLLSMAKIPARREERRETHPLVLAGGICLWYNPEPLADFADICFVGEAEEMLPEFLDLYRERGNRRELLSGSLRMPGVYVPGFYAITYGEDGKILRRTALEGAPAVIRKRTFRDIASSPMRMSVLTPEAEFSDMVLIEAMRGCPWSCRFCITGRIARPVRTKGADAIRREIAAVSGMSGRVGLIGPSLSDYPHVEEVLSIPGVDFSITSLRASPKSARLIPLMAGHRSISIAPEAGTPRLRRVIDKRISGDEIIETAQRILGAGVETLRLYFMVGLPTETREDIQGIIDLVGTIRRSAERGFITLSISTFVPKPFTPFQWSPMEEMKEVKERLKRIKKGLSPLKGVRVFHDMPKYAYLQGLLARGDRRTGEVIGNVASGGFRSLNFQKGCFPNVSVLFRQRTPDEILPWDFIDAGISREGLWDEYQRALTA